jgi:type VI secretion system secreted protein Hcp
MATTRSERATQGKSWTFGSGKRSARRARFFGSGTNAEKDRSSGNWRYTVAAERSRRIAVRIVQAGRLFVLCGVVSVLLPTVQAIAAVDAFMTVEGVKQGPIKGNAMSENIHLVSVVRDTPMATGMATGRRAHSTITIIKEVDAASPKLAMALNSNETLRQVAITFQGGSGDEKTAQKIVLTNATILSVRKSGGNEQITLDYQAIEVTYAKGGKTAMDDWSTPK